MRTYLKDPDATSDYEQSWETWLAGDTITTSQWIAPTGITVDTDSHTTTAATVWLSGGTAGETYEVTNRVTTAAGRSDDRSIRIFVYDR